MSIATCYKKIKDYTEKSGLSDKISTERLREFARQMQALGGDSLTPAEFAAKAQPMLEDQQKRWYDKKNAETAMILLKRENAVGNIISNMEDWKTDIKNGQKGVILKTDTPESMATEAMRVWVEGGSLRPGIETNLSVEKMAHGINQQFRDTFNEAVNKVKTEAASGQLDRQTIQELDAIQNGTTRGQSGSPQAEAYAKAIQTLQDKIFQLKQANNPFMENASEYLMKQFHDRARITADPSDAGKQAWLSQAMSTFGDRSFPENTIAEKQKIFADIYDRISDGRWGTTQDDSASDKYITIKGDGGNILRRMSQSRQLIAKDWSTWADYQGKYGPETIYQGLDRVMSSAARDVSMLTKFGPNPEGMYEGVYQRVLSKLDGKDAANFENSKDFLDRKFSVVTGSQNAPANGTLAKLTQGAMALQFLAKSGTAVFHSLPDISLAASLLRDVNGDSVFSNGAKLAIEYAKGMAPGDYAANNLNKFSLFTKAANAELARAMGPADRPGSMAAMAEKLGSLNLLARHVDAMRSGMAAVLTTTLGDMAPYEFSALPERMQQGLTRYGIQGDEWHVMRTATDKTDGHSVITPESISRLSDTASEIYLRQSEQYTGENAPSKPMLDYGRSQLGLKLSAMINEHADMGAAHPDTRQRSFLWGDTDINQGMGMLARLMTQFKTAALVSNDVYRRAYFSGTGPRGDYAGIVQTMLLGGFLWAVGDAAKQLSDGKTPEDPMSPMYAAKAMVGSGMSGMYGDVLMNELERQGVKDKFMAGSNAITGPVIGTGLEAGADAIQMGSQFFGHERQGKAGAQGLTHLFLGNIPGQNLFYTKAAFNYYLANGVNEFMGPGYLGYMERKTAQTPGLGGGQQQYWLPANKSAW